MEAISHAGTSLGILAKDGVVLAAEKKVASKLLESLRSSEKIYLLNECVDGAERRGAAPSHAWKRRTHALQPTRCAYSAMRAPPPPPPSPSCRNMAASVAGITADANILINYARQAAQRYQLTYQEPIPAEQLVRTVCDLKQGYTQFGGNEPSAPQRPDHRVR